MTRKRPERVVHNLLI